MRMARFSDGMDEFGSAKELLAWGEIYYNLLESESINATQRRSSYQTEKSVYETGRKAAEQLLNHCRLRKKACSSTLGGKGGILSHFGAVSANVHA